MISLEKIFFEAFACENLTREMRAEDVPDWDSFSHLKLILLIEESFNISLSTEEVVGIKSVQDVVALLENRNLVFSFA